MREVEKILASFPGPVVLYAGTLRKLLMLAIFLAFTVFCIWTVATGRTRILHGYYDVVMGPIAVVVFAVLTVRSLILLLVPSAASLTLDADGFSINGIFRTKRTSWRDASGFRVQKGPAGIALVTYDLLPADPEPQHRMSAKMLPLMDSYGQPKNDLAWLMDEWRKRALAQQAG
jgi:presenilin-like A22 family membrane protease